MFTAEDGNCEEICGDGVYLGTTDECDHGNTDSGDGCSNFCTVEPGYSCEGGTECRDAVPPHLHLIKIEKPNVLFL